MDNATDFNRRLDRIDQRLDKLIDSVEKLNQVKYQQEHVRTELDDLKERLKAAEKRIAEMQSTVNTVKWAGTLATMLLGVGATWLLNKVLNLPPP